MSHHTIRRLAVIGSAVSVALVLSACSGSGSSSSAAATDFTFLTINENTTIAAVLTSLSENECSAENAALPLKITKQAQGTLDQQLQLLGGQNALPPAFVSGNSADLTKELFEAGKIVDFAGTDVADSIVPLAASGIKALYGDNTMVLPTELNIEGVWYNKSLLKEAGVTVPDSWDSLVSAFATLSAAGVQPISAAGKGGDGWGVTRWVGAYIFRDIGPDAMTAISNGDATLTDAEYVKAADAVASLGKAGYFGKSVSSIDYATAMNTFLTGKAAFYYQGSWALADFNNEDENKIGTDNIGFIPFPNVAGGKGSADQTPTNIGTDIAFSKSAYDGDSRVRDWASCIAKNYGNVALRDFGQITGFTVTGDVKVAELTQLIQEQIAATETSVGWFESLFNTDAVTTSQNNGGPLGAGNLSGSDFMNTVQAALAG